MKRGIIPYDGFKLVIALLLLLVIFLIGRAVVKSEVSPPSTTAEILETPEPTEETTLEEEPTAAIEATPTPTEEIALEEEPTPEIELLPFPELSDGLSYDVESGFLLSGDGLPIYVLDEYGTDWIPVIPNDLGELELSSNEENEWVLLDDNGEPKYYWDFASHSWVEIPQEQSEEVEVLPCGDTLPPRLIPGESAKVFVRLNFRSSPGISRENWITTLRPGTQLKVLGETFCTEYNHGSYLWWYLEREDGTRGWSAEAPINGSYYFLEPVE